MVTSNTFSALDRMLSLNRVLDEAFMNGSQVWVPSLDIVEKDDAYHIALEIPGVDPDSVDISFEQNVLTVKGEKTFANTSRQENDNVRVYAAERTSGKFHRAVRLPEFVDVDNITAESKHGVLYLTVPKAQSAKPRKISIKGSGAKQISAT